jgi:hypothetical protein
MKALHCVHTTEHCGYAAYEMEACVKTYFIISHLFYIHENENCTLFRSPDKRLAILGKIRYVLHIYAVGGR